MPNLRCEAHHRICNLRYGTHGYGMSAYKRGRISCFDFMNIVSREYPNQNSIDVYTSAGFT